MMKLDIINGWTGKRRTAIVEVNHRRGGIDCGYWLDDQTELDEDEIIMLEETFAEDLLRYSREYHQEEEMERRYDK
jgi:hypothetical protein